MWLHSKKTLTHKFWYADVLHTSWGVTPPPHGRSTYQLIICILPCAPTYYGQYSLSPSLPRYCHSISFRDRMTVTKIAEKGVNFKVVRGQNIPRNARNRGSRVSSKCINRGRKPGSSKLKNKGRIRLSIFLSNPNLCHTI